LKAPYAFRPAAEDELREIIRYTQKNWGDAQAKKYAAKLRECIQALATGEKPCKDMSELYPALRMAHCERHCIGLSNRMPDKQGSKLRATKTNSAAGDAANEQS